MTRRLRLWSGLVMLAYVTMHLANHAMGLISLRAMNSVLGWVLWLWGNQPAQVLLYGAFLVHFTLALWALWERRSLRLKIGEWFQVVLGFAIPILLARHVVGNRLSHDLFGTTNNNYTAV
jgi:adenylate cyclase